MAAVPNQATLIWGIADDALRGAFKAHEYGDVTLPFVLLRRLDCVFRPHRESVAATYAQYRDALTPDQLEPVLMAAAGDAGFYNASSYDLERLKADANHIELNFTAYLNGFSANVREILESYHLDPLVRKLAENDLLWMMCDKLAAVDLHPSVVSNHDMGLIFEELLRRFSEMSNETAGEHYTPREVIRLMVSLLFAEHRDELEGKGVVRSIYDPACGTGGMLTIAREHIAEINPDVEVMMFGQELNDKTYAIAKSDFLITGADAGRIRLGSSLTRDQFRGDRFDYMLSNPPFGVSWKKEQAAIEKESRDPHGRFSAGLPRTSDGALLFLQHMLSKMDVKQSRIAIIFNGSPLFTGDAGSGESEIRKWIIENDWLEAIVALPTELFYNTGIATYIWIVTNRKPERRRGKVQLINGVGFGTKMRKSLGSKRQYIAEEEIARLVELYTAFEPGEEVRIFENAEFGYTKVRVERPELNDKGEPKLDKQGRPKPSTDLRDYERVPLTQDVDDYFEREVKPHVPDAWMDRAADKVGYEINFTRYFYTYEKLRSVEEIREEILALDAETEGMLREVLG